eukprot:2271087-Prymnesium_polylepis.1
MGIWGAEVNRSSQRTELKAHAHVAVRLLSQLDIEIKRCGERPLHAIRAAQFRRQGSDTPAVDREIQRQANGGRRRQPEQREQPPQEVDPQHWQN